jgi:hypothetical protein
VHHDVPPAAALLGAVAAGALAVGPVPELGFVLQGTGLGALIGAALAERRRSRNPEYDGSRLIVRWSVALGVAFAAAALLDGLL